MHTEEIRLVSNAKVQLHDDTKIKPAKGARMVESGGGPGGGG